MLVREQYTDQGVRVWYCGVDIHYLLVYLSQVLHWPVIIGVRLFFPQQQGDCFRLAEWVSEFHVLAVALHVE